MFLCTIDLIVSMNVQKASPYVEKARFKRLTTLSFKGRLAFTVQFIVFMFCIMMWQTDSRKEPHALVRTIN